MFILAGMLDEEGVCKLACSEGKREHEGACVPCLEGEHCPNSMFLLDFLGISENLGISFIKFNDAQCDMLRMTCTYTYII